MDDKFAIMTGPSARERARGSQLVHVAFETTMGAFYSFPDMLQEHLHELLQQFDSVAPDKIIARNVSEVTILLPLRIIKAVHLMEVDDDWKIHASSPQARMSTLWERGG
jgi:hypothetical protein